MLKLAKFYKGINRNPLWTEIHIIKTGPVNAYKPRKVLVNTTTVASLYTSLNYYKYHRNYRYCNMVRVTTDKKNMYVHIHRTLTLCYNVNRVGHMLHNYSISATSYFMVHKCQSQQKLCNNSQQIDIYIESRLRNVVNTLKKERI